MSQLEKNLAGLRRWMPGTAGRLEAAGIPAGFVERVGTDGTPTYAREEDGKVKWLGGTSMPRESAVALVKALDAGGGANGLGLSIGSGFEWAAFMRKLGAAQALFVYESDAGLARMALSVCDPAGLLENGKMILVVGTAEEAGAELSRFLSEHIGYETPSVLHPLATLVGERRNVLLAAGEKIVRRVIAERQALVAELAGRWREEEKTQSVLAITRGSRYAGERPLEDEIAERGAREVRVDDFATCAEALRLKAVVEWKPGRVLSDFFRVQLGCVPGTVGVETWIPPGVGMRFWETLPGAETLGAADRVVVHGAAHEVLLLEKGFAKSQVESRALRLRGSRRELGKGHRVALIGELLCCDAETLGVTLPTHQAVFAAAKEILREEYLTAHFGAAADILRRAMERAGAAGNDAALRESMLKLIRHVLLPNVPLMTLAGELQRQEVPLKLIGDWSGLEKSGGTVVRRFGAEDSWDEVGVLVHFSPWGIVLPVVGHAMAAGVAVTAPQHPTDEFAGSLAKLLTPEVEYARPARQQFFAALKGLLKDEKKRAALAAAARKKLAGAPV